MINQIRTTPFLMRDNIDFAVHLGLLDKLAVCAHTLFGVCGSELIGDKGCTVQTGKGDELPAVAELAEALNVGKLFVLGHGCFPVEGW